MMYKEIGKKLLIVVHTIKDKIRRLKVQVAVVFHKEELGVLWIDLDGGDGVDGSGDGGDDGGDGKEDGGEDGQDDRKDGDGDDGGGGRDGGGDGGYGCGRGRGGQKRKRDALEKRKGIQLLDKELDEEDGGEEEDLQITNDLIRSDNNGDGDDGTTTGYDPYFKPLDTNDPLWL
ncbi:hypothetical protein LguiB_023711 [Lonicera macranthoides]